MKIFRGDSSSDDFEPYDITITVETQKDERLLHRITMTNNSIPRVVAEYASDKALTQPTEQFLRSLQKSLRTKGT